MFDFQTIRGPADDALGREAVREAVRGRAGRAGPAGVLMARVSLGILGLPLRLIGGDVPPVLAAPNLIRVGVSLAPLSLGFPGARPAVPALAGGLVVFVSVLADLHGVVGLL